VIEKNEGNLDKYTRSKFKGRDIYYDWETINSLAFYFDKKCKNENNKRLVTIIEDIIKREKREHRDAISEVPTKVETKEKEPEKIVEKPPKSPSNSKNDTKDLLSKLREKKSTVANEPSASCQLTILKSTFETKIPHTQPL